MFALELGVYSESDVRRWVRGLMLCVV